MELSELAVEDQVFGAGSQGLQPQILHAATVLLSPLPPVKLHQALSGVQAEVVRGAGQAGVLLFGDIQVIVNKKLPEGNLLLKTSSVELISDCTSVVSIDHPLITWLSKRQMIDLMCHIEISRSKRVDVMNMNVIDNEALARCNVETSTNPIDRMSKVLEF